jgi:hypothetical protein
VNKSTMNSTAFQRRPSHAAILVIYLEARIQKRPETNLL